MANVIKDLNKLWTDALAAGAMTIDVKKLGSQLKSLDDLAELTGSYSQLQQAAASIRSEDPEQAKAARGIVQTAIPIGNPSMWSENDYINNATGIIPFATETALQYFRPNRDKLVDMLPGDNLEKMALGITPVKLSDSVKTAKLHNGAYDLHMAWQKVSQLNAAYAQEQIREAEYMPTVADMVSKSVSTEFKKAGYNEKLQKAAAGLIQGMIMSNESHARLEGQRFQLKKQNQFIQYFKDLASAPESMHYGVADYARENLRYVDISKDDAAIKNMIAITSAIPPKKK